MIGRIHSGGHGFKGAVGYLLYGKKDAPNPERVAWSMTRNMVVDDAGLAPAIMQATAMQSARCKKPAYHFCVSWRHDENPTDEIMRMVGDSTIAELGLEDHQALLVAHNDTAHKHLHILVNRIHPGTRKAWHTGKDYERLEKSMARQAKLLGFEIVPGRHNAPEHAVKAPKHAKNGEYQMAKRENKPRPLDHWSVEEIKSRRQHLAPIFQSSRSWDQLAMNLAREGLKLEKKGQGIIIADAFGFMKLSDLGKEVRLKTLEDSYREKFSAFTARGGNEGLMFPEGPLSPREPTPATDPIPHPNEKNLRRPIHGEGADDEGDGYAPSDEASDHELDEYEKERLREEERERRIAERKAQLDARDKKRTDAWDEAEDANGAVEQALTPDYAGRAAPSAQPKDPLSEAHESLSTARDVLDLAYALGSLVTEAQLERAKHDVELAQEKVDQELSFAEKLKSDIAEALQGKPKPPPQPLPEPEPEHDEDDEMEM